MNGKILVSDGVINNLVEDGIIPEKLGRDLKNLDFNDDGSLKTRKPRSGSAKSKNTAERKYLANLAKIYKSQPIKIATNRTNNIIGDVTGLTFSG